MPCAPSKLNPCGSSGSGGGGSGGGVYLGRITVTQLATKCTPTPTPGTNDYYEVTTAGAACGETYATGDRAVWSGTAWVPQSGPSGGGGMTGTKATATINIPKITSPTNSWTSANVAVVGAVLGDWVIVSANKNTQGIVFIGNVTTPGQVAITGINCTGGAVTLGSTLFNITVISPT